MKQEVPKPVLVIAAILGVLALGFIVMKGMRAGEPNIDPELDKKTAEYLGSVRAIGTEEAKGAAPAGSEQAAREAAGAGGGPGPR